MSASREKTLHDNIGLLDLRAQATAAAVVQICIELHNQGMFDEGAISRIKETIARDIALSRPRRPYQTEFDEAMRRLDEIFAGRATLPRTDIAGSAE